MRTAALVTALLGQPAFAESRIVFDGDSRLAHEIVTGEPVAAGRAQSRTVYLNRTGIDLQPGASNSRLDRSSMVKKAASIPPWNASEELWTETVTCLREMFAPFDLRLTETNPGDVPHIEAVFGGSGTLLGLHADTRGVAPFSTTCSVIESSIVFAFTDAIPASSKLVCEVMAHEIAHSFGLDHELLAEDPMTYLSFAGKRSFQDTVAACGETEARPCGARGYPSCRTEQSSYALLLERLGPAPAGSDGGDDDAVGSSDEVGCSTTRRPSEGLFVVICGLAVLASRRRRFRHQ